MSLMTPHNIPHVIASIVLKGDRIWGFDWYLVVYVMVTPLVFDLNARRGDNEMGQLYSNNRGLARNYPRENTISQLAGNRSALVFLVFCLSYFQIDLDLFEAIQETTKHVHVLIRVLPSC